MKEQKKLEMQMFLLFFIVFIFFGTITLTIKLGGFMTPKIDKKLNNFDERLEAMEDIDAKKLDVAKAGILAIVTIATTLITSYYNSRNNVDENALIKVLEHIDDVGNSNFSEFEKRLCALEAK